MLPPTCASPGSTGQATLEAIAVIPLLLLAGFAGLALLDARAATGRAEAAAKAGAMALLQDEDPKAAARAALAAGERGRAAVRIAGSVVTVTLRPARRSPFSSVLGAATARADAGPEAAR